MKIIPKHWKGKAPILDPEIIAHPRGNIQWSCPDCGYLHSRNTAFSRRAMIRCAQKTCRHKFRVGLGFNTFPGSKCLLVGDWKLNIANCKGLPADWVSSLPGRVTGPIDWVCPDCQKTVTSHMNFKHSAVECCQRWFVQLLIYRPSGSRNITPFDWSVPNVQKTHPSLAAQKTGTS